MDETKELCSIRLDSEASLFLNNSSTLVFEEEIRGAQDNYLKSSLLY